MTDSEYANLRNREASSTPANWSGYKDIKTLGGFNSPPQTVDTGALGNLIKSLINRFRPTLVSPAPTSTEPDYSKMKITYGRVKPSTPPTIPTNKPIPSSQPQQTTEVPSFYFDYGGLRRDQQYADTGSRPNFNPSQPPTNIATPIRRHFPNEATAAALVAGTENAAYDPRRADNINPVGGIDRGIFQINSNTFNGLMQRQGELLKSYGINSFEDMYDPDKNAFVAKLIHQNSQQANPQTAGWGPWYGWQSTGYDINKGYYSHPERIKYELNKRR